MRAVASVESLGDRFAERSRESWMLEHALTLEIDVGVPAARQTKVPRLEHAVAFEYLSDLGGVHDCSSLMIASAAARGSGARVIGRPITMRSAPAAIASAGLAARI